MACSSRLLVPESFPVLVSQIIPYKRLHNRAINRCQMFLGTLFPPEPDTQVIFKPFALSPVPPRPAVSLFSPLLLFQIFCSFPAPFVPLFPPVESRVVHPKIKSPSCILFVGGGHLFGLIFAALFVLFKLRRRTEMSRRGMDEITVSTATIATVPMHDEGYILLFFYEIFWTSNTGFYSISSRFHGRGSS